MKKYKFNINAIMEWCLASSKNPIKETEFNEGYDTNENGDLQMMTKVVRELKTTNSQDDTFRYDFIKLMLSPFFNEIFSLEDIENNWSYKTLFNTFIDMGFLVEINE